jgi:hypothetical protein
VVTIDWVQGLFESKVNCAFGGEEVRGKQEEKKRDYDEDERESP